MLGYLKFTVKVLTKPTICNHYVLHTPSKTKFFVLTSKKIKGLKSHFISNKNIDGKFVDQYVIENAHVFDPSKHIIEYSAKGMQYLLEHQEKFQPVLEALKNLPQ